jgi:ribosomal protein S27E
VAIEHYNIECRECGEKISYSESHKAGSKTKLFRVHFTCNKCKCERTIYTESSKTVYINGGTIISTKEQI